MPIKPEDVTQDHIAKLESYLKGRYDWSEMSDSAETALMANAMIEAGIVSPPVWVVRDGPNGWLQTDEDNMSLYLSQTNTNILPQSYRYEHWKGQTE
jgi:hypothetical protein